MTDLLMTDDWSERARMRGRELSEAWSEWLGPVAWQFFVTLTFDPKRAFPVNSALASREAFWWRSQVGRVTRRPVGWLYAAERGALPRACLLVGVPESLGPAPFALWRQRNGHIHVEPVYAAGGAVLYTTKDAALAGEVVFSDTLGRYRSHPSTTRIALCPP